jgi:hypothetical protein
MSSNDEAGGAFLNRSRRLIGPKACTWLAAIALVTGLVLVAPGAAAAASGPTQLTSCSFSALQTAVSGGGTIDYEQDCYNSSRVVFPNEISFKGTADIEANGFTILFYGSNSTRFFELESGKLTISEIDLYGGGAIGQSGQSGGIGENGQDGDNGS